MSCWVRYNSLVSGRPAAWVPSTLAGSVTVTDVQWWRTGNCVLLTFSRCHYPQCWHIGKYAPLLPPCSCQPGHIAVPLLTSGVGWGGGGHASRVDGSVEEPARSGVQIIAPHGFRTLHSRYLPEVLSSPCTLSPPLLPCLHGCSPIVWRPPIDGTQL